MVIFGHYNGITEHLSLPIKAHGVDLYHSPFQYLPFRLSIPQVVTIHDVMRLLFPKWSYTNTEFIMQYGTWTFLQMALYSFLNAYKMSGRMIRDCFSESALSEFRSPSRSRSFFKLHHAYQWEAISRSIESASSIITPSEVSSADLVSITDVRKDVVSVIPLAADPVFHPDADQSFIFKIRSRYELPDKFALYVSSWRPHKNVHTLLRSFANLVSNTGEDFGLVLVSGLDDPRSLFIQELISKINSTNQHVVVISGISEKELLCLYQTASFFITLSLYEGFCLPVIEAMACGCPVISSNRGALPEVADGSSWLVEPNNDNEIVRAMEAFFSESTIRKEYREKGLKRAEQFSWEMNAMKTIGFYERCIHS